MAGPHNSPGQISDPAQPLAGEAEHAASLVRLLGAIMERESGTGPGARPMLRDAHPKIHGLVEAEFTVLPDLDPALAVGVLQPGRKYRALIRFSNQNARVSSDSRRDIRGAAIKLLDVDPPVLEQDEPGRATQDFILITADRFVTADVAQFNGLVRAISGGRLPEQAWFFIRHLRAAWNLFISLRSHDNPLGVRYFSVVPYRLGERAVKYSLIPRNSSVATVPRGTDHLRQAMVAQLGEAPVEFDFAVQFQVDPRRMPIEDAGVRWSEALAPFQPVATVRIPMQVFDTDDRRSLAERLAFNPWHARVEHRPIGGINRARRIVYRALSDFRRERNGTRVPREGP